jgi:hypothetical protein
MLKTNNTTCLAEVLWCLIKPFTVAVALSEHSHLQVVGWHELSVAFADV